MRYSLTLRLLLSASVVLAAFFGIAGFVLESAFVQGAEQATRERLQAQIYALLSAADLNTSGRLSLPDRLPEPRFSTPGSGLYGAVFDRRGKPVWRSRSAIGNDLKAIAGLSPGHSDFRVDKAGWFVLYYPLVWEDRIGQDRLYLFVVAEDTDAVEKEISGFSDTLWHWLGGIGLALVIVQVGVLGWSLRPLRSLAREIEEIETGVRQRLADDYPRELQGVAANVNALLDAGHAHLDRYRNTLSNLAHSLKTPLAILRGCCNEPGIPTAAKAILGEQVSRMDDLIEYQLQRAAAKGINRLAPSLAVVPVIAKLIDALKKVYASKSPMICLRAGKNFQFACEEGDLLEIAGNLIDNACKWSRSEVRVTLGYRSNPAGLELAVEDDGPGIPEDKLATVLRRGVRADEATHGHGIGLSVVSDLIRFSDGRLEASVSELGGLRWDVWLPGRGSVEIQD